MPAVHAGFPDHALSRASCSMTTRAREWDRVYGSEGPLVASSDATPPSAPERERSDNNNRHTYRT